MLAMFIYHHEKTLVILDKAIVPIYSIGKNDHSFPR